MAVTTVDIARELNLSQTTISKVLSGRNNASIPEATRERVLRAAAEMGYRPNHMARVLRSGRSHLINLLIRRVHPAFFSRLIAEFRSILRGSGYDLRIQETFGRTDQEWQDGSAHNWPADGVIVIESVESIDRLMKGSRDRVPIVNVGSIVDTGVDHVEIDLYAGTREALRHLQAAGRSRIAYLRPAFALSTSRSDAYTEAILQSGAEPLFITPEAIRSESERSLGMKAVADFLRTSGNDIDALACFNDELAIGALRAFRENGVRVPEDVAVVGCDDIEEAAYCNPSLSTLHYPYEEAARLAWSMLLRRIEDRDLPTQNAIMPSTLVVRQSSIPSAQFGRIAS